jgi:predicted metalloendopeptidase
MKRTIYSALIMGLFCTAVGAAGPQSGVDVANVDQTVRAQDDFFRYSQGKWLKDVDIPADRASWGAFNIAQETVENQVRTIIEQSEQDKKRAPGSDAQKIGDFYASFMDEARRNAQGLAPLKGELARIAAIGDQQGIAVQMAHMLRIGAGAPIDMSIHQDNKDSTRYVADIAQSGLGMPNRDYYLSDKDARLADIRAKYQVHVEKMLALAGHAQAAAEAAQVVALETDIVRIQWTAVENRDPVKAYNKLSLAQLRALMPGFDWTPVLKDAGVAGKVDTLIVSQPSYLAGLDQLVAQTPLPVWKTYFECRLVSAYAPYLSQAFVDESFAFRGGVLSGAKVNRPLQKRAIAEVNRSLGEVAGKAYVKQYFPAARLQYPLYDPDAEPAINYGAVGISIGHEISHAFDDQGARFDGDGNLRNWWTREDGEKFAARGKVLVARYGAYSPLAGYTLNGELTLGENIADNAGAIMATRAYKISLNGKPGPVIDGFSAEQRLFMGLAQARRGKARDAALIAQVKSDPHSPAEFRVNGSLKNHPGFYEAFDVKPGDTRYLAPEERVIFW